MAYQGTVSVFLSDDEPLQFRKTPCDIKNMKGCFDPLGIDDSKSDFERLAEEKAALSAARRGDRVPINIGPNATRTYEQEIQKIREQGGSNDRYSQGDLRLAVIVLSAFAVLCAYCLYNLA